MTLTHALPSLRRTMADPLDTRRWPAHTIARPGDVVVAGVSLRRLVDWCGGTPCLHSGDGDAVLVAAVEAVEERCGDPLGDADDRILDDRILDDRILDVWLDAELDHCEASVAEARLIGRVSTARDVRAALRPSHDLEPATWVPADLRPGDLLAIPVRGVPRLGAVLRGALDPARES